MNIQKTVGICCAGVGTEYQSKICNYLLDQMRMTDWLRLMFFTCYSDSFSGSAYDLGEENIFRLINFEKLDALIILTDTIKSRSALSSLIERAEANNVPVISFDGIEQGCCSIIFDDAGAVYSLTKHLIADHGRRRINFMAGDNSQKISAARTEAYRRALEEYGIRYEQERVGEGMWWDETTQPVVKKWLESGMEFDAVVCANDVMAMAVIDELTSHGISVPEEVSVTGIDELEEGRYHTPVITTAGMCYKEAAEKVISVIYDLINGTASDKVYEFSCKVRYGGSCGCNNNKTEDINKYHHEYVKSFDSAVSFNQELCRMNSRLVECSAVHESIDLLKQDIMNTWTKKMWVCVREGFFTNHDEYNNSGLSEYPEKMELIAFKNGFSQGQNKTFETKELLPRLEEELNECRSLLFTPLHVNNKAVGYIVKEHAASYVEYEWFSYAMHLSNSLETIRQQSQMREMISTLENMYIRDSMTQLYNRRGFFRILRETLQNNKVNNVMIISIDVDGLKEINDVYGHLEGDFAINTIARALNSVSVKGEICARFGGDEFIAAGCNVSEEYQENYGNRFKEYLDYFNKHSGKSYEIKASVGAVVKCTDSYDDIDELIRLADEKMYSHKSANRSSYRTRR